MRGGGADDGGGGGAPAYVGRGLDSKWSCAVRGLTSDGRWSGSGLRGVCEYEMAGMGGGGGSMAKDFRDVGGDGGPEA